MNENGKKLKDMTIEERRKYFRDAQRKWREKHNLNPTHKIDLYKDSIPIEERCEGFDELWDMTYRQVLSYWNHIPKYCSKYNVDTPTKKYPINYYEKKKSQK